jgi:hypothetical protein
MGAEASDARPHRQPELDCDRLGAMPLKSIRAWRGVGAPEEQEFSPLRDTLEALDHLEPDRARFLAAFAYLLGRVAHAGLRTIGNIRADSPTVVRSAADLGPATAIADELNKQYMLDDVAVLVYRAPEILLLADLYAFVQSRPKAATPPALQ